MAVGSAGSKTMPEAAVPAVRSSRGEWVAWEARAERPPSPLVIFGRPQPSRSMSRVGPGAPAVTAAMGVMEARVARAVRPLAEANQVTALAEWLAHPPEPAAMEAKAGIRRSLWANGPWVPRRL